MRTEKLTAHPAEQLRRIGIKTRRGRQELHLVRILRRCFESGAAQGFFASNDASESTNPFWLGARNCL
jgi:hypothetical protein